MVCVKLTLPSYPLKTKNKNYISFVLFFFKENIGPVWYMCLKTENYCVKIFVKIRMDEKVCGNK